MQVNLQGQVALVTGGAQGIGRAIVEAFAANGAAVAIVDRDAEAGQAAVAELTAQGHKTVFLPADVTDSDRMRHVVEKIQSSLGPIGILVNNAGGGMVTGRVPIHEFADEDWHSVLHSNLTGVFVVSRAVIPQMLERGGGRIINIASVAGLVPLRLQSAYVAAKAGVVNLTRSMAIELGSRGILSNCVCPGSTLTRGTREVFYRADGTTSELAASLLSHIPLGRPAEPQEIAHAVLFLAAPESSYINGAVLPVDGGWTSGYTRDW
jgi:NAD(P)-dependent dehydrogenase (short-subunit alcohol dehydrogenase family)